MRLLAKVHRAARAEFIAAASRYEAERPGLGAEFIAEIDRCISLAAEQPKAYAVVHDDLRRVTSHGFPFSVYFRIEAARIVVLAVFHGRRNPSIWRRRA